MTDDEREDGVLAAWGRLSARSRPLPVVRRDPVRTRGPQSRTAIPATAVVIGVFVIAVGVVRLGGPAESSPIASPTAAGSVIGVAPSFASGRPPGSATNSVPSPTTPPPSRSVFAGAFVTAVDGWAVTNDGEGNLFVTHDGGRSWTPTTKPAPGERVMNAAFADALHGWVVGETYPAQDESGELVVNVHRTDDGGATWQTIEMARVPSPGPDAMIGFPGFSVLSADRVFVMLSLADFGPHVSRLYVTTDGGRTWERRSGVTEAGRSSFVDETRGWAIRNDTAVLVRTTDGGRSWSRAALPNLPGPSDVPYYASIPILSPDGRLILTMSSGRDGDPQFILTSADGGSSWTVVGQTPDGAGAVSAVLGDGTWILGGDPVRRSQDNGATWVPAAAGPPGGVGQMTVAGGTVLSGIVATPRPCSGPPATVVDCLVPHELWISDDGGESWRDTTP